MSIVINKTQIKLSKNSSDYSFYRGLFCPSKLIQSVIRGPPTGQWFYCQIPSWVCLWKSIKLIWNTSSDVKSSCPWFPRRATTAPGSVQKCVQDPGHWVGTWTVSLPGFLSSGEYGCLTSGVILWTAGSPPPGNNKLYGRQARPSNSAEGKMTTKEKEIWSQVHL